jgi:hypothetical protein
MHGHTPGVDLVVPGPPEPIRTKFLQMIVETRPWFRLGAHLVWERKWPCTVKRIDLDSWTFHVERPGKEKWYQHRLYDLATQFAPAEPQLDKIEKVLDAAP